MMGWGGSGDDVVKKKKEVGRAREEGMDGEEDVIYIIYWAGTGVEQWLLISDEDELNLCHDYSDPFYYYTIIILLS